MGVQVDRYVQFFFQRSDQLFGRIRLHKSGHILDGKDVASQAFQFFRLFHIVVQRIFCLIRIQNIPGITDSSFHDLTGL